MSCFIFENTIMENKDNSVLSYIFEDSQLFFEIGYKVVQSLDKVGFIRCFKLLHNGKIKLIYNLTGYKTFQSVLGQVSADILLVIVSKLFTNISEVKNNGFIQCENIDTRFDNIYLDEANNPLLVYLPVNSQLHPEDADTFDNRLKSVVAHALSEYGYLEDENASKLYTDLKSDTLSVEAIMKKLKLGYRTGTNMAGHYFPTSFLVNTPQKSNWMPTDNRQEIKKLYANPQPAYNAVAQTESNPHPTDKITADIESEKLLESSNKNVLTSLSGLFSFRRKKESDSEIFAPSIALCSTKTPENIDIIISKPDFIIGSNPQSSDGVIEFNKAISRVHCKITYIGGKYYICDMGSSNGTYVNSAKLLPGKQVPVKIGDMINLANSEFILKEIDS